MSLSTGMGVRSIKDVATIEATPLSEHDLPESTHAALSRAAARWPDKAALHYFEDVTQFGSPLTLSFAEFLAEINRTANLLRALGIGRGDVVAYLLPNLPETHMLIWGGETAGIVLAVNPALGVNDIVSILTEAETKVLAALGPSPGSDIWEKAAQAAPRVSTLQSVLCIRSDKPVDRIGMVPVEDFATQRASMPDRLTFDPPRAGDLSSFFCTGGTTGRPKIARRRNASEVFDAWAVAAHSPEVFNPGAVGFCGLPLFHVNAQLVTGLATWMRGGTVVLATPSGYRDPAVIGHCWDIFAHYRVTFFSGVPTIYAGLLSVPQQGQDISALGFGICGAAPMPVELFRQFQDTTGVRILEGYGMTEGCCVSSINPPSGERRVGSVGLRLPYQDLRAAELGNDGQFIRWRETDEVGTLLLFGPNVFEGYCDPEHTRAIWVQVGSDLWFNTGDLGRQDADGYFWLTGRRKDLIIRGGHNIDPAVIEAAAHAHPAVALAAAVGRPDAHSGEVPVLYVELRQGAVISAEALQAEISASIEERAARPKAVRIIKTMPLTAVGKIFKPDLSMREVRDVVLEQASLEKVKLSNLVVRQDRSGRIEARCRVAQAQSKQIQANLSRFNFLHFVDLV